jgi:hypothetical protein
MRRAPVRVGLSCRSVADPSLVGQRLSEVIVCRLEHPGKQLLGPPPGSPSTHLREFVLGAHGNVDYRPAGERVNPPPEFGLSADLEPNLFPDLGPPQRPETR